MFNNQIKLRNSNKEGPETVEMQDPCRNISRIIVFKLNSLFQILEQYVAGMAKVNKLMTIAFKGSVQTSGLMDVHHYKMNIVWLCKALDCWNLCRKFIGPFDDDRPETQRMGANGALSF